MQLESSCHRLFFLPIQMGFTSKQFQQIYAHTHTHNIASSHSQGSPNCLHILSAFSNSVEGYPLNESDTGAGSAPQDPLTHTSNLPSSGLSPSTRRIAPSVQLERGKHTIFKTELHSEVDRLKTLKEQSCTTFLDCSLQDTSWRIDETLT